MDILSLKIFYTVLEMIQIMYVGDKRQRCAQLAFVAEFCVVTSWRARGAGYVVCLHAGDHLAVTSLSYVILNYGIDIVCERQLRDIREVCTH